MALWTQRRVFLDRARALWHTATMVCVTHDVAHTQALDHVVIVEGGCIIEQGAPAALAARAGSRYRQLLDAELSARDTVWTGPGWRQITLKDGRVAGHAATPA